MAGLSASAAVGGINIDKTPPGIVIDSPRPITYANTGSIGVAWTPSDGLSGIASEKGSVDGAAVTNAQELSLLLFPAGDHQVKVVAVDLADNAGQATMSFFVSVNIDGLIAATQGACGSSLIVKAGICHSLTAKLLAAKAAVERGDFVPARNELHAFLNEMDAQLDKAIEGKAYKVLTADARYVIARLP